MKELSIEEKAKRYDELKVTAQGLEHDGCFDELTLFDLFPELKESDDERIRKALIEMVHDTTGDSLWVDYNVHKEDALSWLEKQGEQKSLDDIVKEVTKDKDAAVSFLKSTGIINENGELADEYKIEQCEQKPTDKVEPKFHEGQWITNGDYTWKIVEVKSLDYILQSQDGNIVDDTISHVDEQFHSFTIEDAKDGDVLADKYNNIGIFQECEGICWHSYIYLGCDGKLRGFSICGRHEQTDTHPATKEQRDLLFQKMKEAGYEWDDEKKELKKEEVDNLHNYLYGEQKPTWSEEDEAGLGDTLWAIQQAGTIAKDENDMGNLWYAERWLNSLKGRIRPKQEWSEEDEDNFKHLLDEIVCLGNNRNSANRLYYDRLIKFIEELKNRAQPKEKWCDKDERMLDRLIAYFEKQVAFTDDDNPRYANWLKSLKERYTWKPSDEQMQALSNAGNSFRPFEEGHKVLWSLYNDLKKLREE